MPVANLEETDYLVLRWRKAGGERVVVETAVAERAKHFSVSPDVYWNTVPHPIQDRRYDLLASRLKRNEDPIDVFEGAVRAAVNERKDEDTRPVAQILRFWMERHGISGVKILQPEILNWLDHYNLNPQASYVIPALLEIGVIDDQELFVRVTDLATARLRENMGTRNKGDFYVLRGWVRSHRQVEPIADLFRQWLLDNSPLSEKKPKNLLSHSEVSNGRN